MKGTREIAMNGLYLIGALIIYFLLTWVVLPKLGVPT